MFELVIFNPDGTRYWTAYFNTRADAEKWLAEEQTRLYWNPDYTSVITDKTPPKPTPEELAEQQANEKKRIDAKERLKKVDWVKIKGDPTLIAIVKDLVDGN